MSKPRRGGAFARQVNVAPAADTVSSLTFDLYERIGATGRTAGAVDERDGPTDFLDAIPLLTLTSVVNPLLSSGSIYCLSFQSTQSTLQIA